ncbi:MAG: flagellar hook-basal body complex protein [Victivallales bacterium]|nr:flagellar hook-basal body complex protein [Victivallales bacterium]
MGMMNIGASGMSAQSVKLNTISNNIANSDTLSYKAQRVNFAEAYVAAGGQRASGNILQNGTGVSVASTNADWSNGAMETTNEPSNLMLSGDGFFLVSLNNETYYTRAGDFSLVANPSGDGYVLMRPNGAVLTGYDAAAGTYGDIAFTGYDSTGAVVDLAPSSYTIASDGSITAQPDAASDPYIQVSNGNIRIQRFNNPDSLVRTEEGLYQPTVETSYNTTAPVTPGEDGSGTVLQGALEGSNTDLITEFTNMIGSQRAFQANSKVITTADELLQTVMNMKR